MKITGKTSYENIKSANLRVNWLVIQIKKSSALENSFNSQNHINLSFNQNTTILDRNGLPEIRICAIYSPTARLTGN
jgi:hypothetical protein